MGTRGLLSVSDFAGVDFTSPVLDVEDSQSINILNIRKKDGRDQKRKGFEQTFQAPSFAYYTDDGTGTYTAHSNTFSINGLWAFTGEDGNEHVFAHIGKLLCELKGITDARTSEYKFLYELKDTYRVCIELPDRKTEGFVSGNRLYLLTGDGYYCLRCTEDKKTVFFRVAGSEDAYVPVTTIGIVYSGGTGARSALDDVNLLTPMRRNRLTSGTKADDDSVTTEFYEYTLDTTIVKIPTKAVKDTVTVKIDYIGEAE